MSRMHEEQEMVLTTCLEEILAGRSTAADCLERHPLHREYLAEMLPLGLELAQMPGMDPSPECRLQGRARLLASIARARAVQSAARTDDRRPAGQSAFHSARRILAPILILFFFLPALLCMGGTTVVSAAERSIPGDPLYGLDTALESLQFLLTWDTAARMDLALGIAAERIAELQELTDQEGSAEHIQQAMDGYRRAMDQTADVLSHSDKPEERRRLEADIAAEISKDLQVLVSLRDRLPEKADAALDRAVEKSLQDEKKLEEGSFGPPLKDAGSHKPEKTKTPGKDREKEPGKPD